MVQTLIRKVFFVSAKEHSDNTSNIHFSIVEAKAPVNGWLVPFDAIDKPETQVSRFINLR